MTVPRYPIPAATTRVEIMVVNSRFIATIGEAQNAAQAKAFIENIRTEFNDAAHNVFAYVCGFGSSVTEGMSDDGEPPGTAGRPSLAVLRGSGLGDVVLVTTRYFGGTKLGTGGLVRAYTQAAQTALEALPRSERVEIRHGLLEVPYPLYERARLLIAAEKGTVEKEEFGAAVQLMVVFAVDRVSGFEAGIRELSAGKSEIVWED